ncbi:SNF2-related protein [Limisalsivibrio acetivorans]|uniref:SNF2-related protein n=1 Tax=Limisalsivibrio acetivorans TaxID=1304888 RepID=UPI0003B2EFAC|nr:SNF2-related protein [Limisalsivibrio acetivorans]
MSTGYHAKYIAHKLTSQNSSDDFSKLSMSLFDATVDLNPHQIEASLFALNNPLSKGVILADEVGLGKTIEAGLVLCQFWSERKRDIIVICPASLRKQWANELYEKFSIPSIIIDSKKYKELKKEGSENPFKQKHVIITSFHFAARLRDELKLVSWDLAVIDEAHKLRNAHQQSNFMGQSLRWALEDVYKILLTATPLQNSLMELYGLSTLIDDNLFGEPASFRSMYMNYGADIEDLRNRLSQFCKRTLRRQVLEYIKYTERRALTQPFNPTTEEHKLYDAISEFLLREDTYAIPTNQRHLVVLILRKLLASSSAAIASTLETIKNRLISIKEGVKDNRDLVDRIIDEEEIEDDFLEEDIEVTETSDNENKIDLKKLEAEILELDQYIRWAKSIGIDSKTRALMSALKVGFAEMQKMGAAKKAVIFTESRKTQDYLANFLESNGYYGKVVLFNGSNNSENTKQIYNDWLTKNLDSGKSTSSKAIDIRAALIDYFEDEGEIFIATEAAAEGVNLQFCSLVINYDLPWNPQRVEQRIGRCHRYGQKHDVVVINFINKRNAADMRIYELLEQKFNLFNGVFGASDEVLGSIESGVDFEKRVLKIYQECRTEKEIEKAFNQLQQEMDEQIKSRMTDVKEQLFEHFDEDVHSRLKFRLEDTKRQLRRFEKDFWTLTRFILSDKAKFNDTECSFSLKDSPAPHIKTGNYHMVSKDHVNIHGDYLYRLSHPLGEYVLDCGKQYPVETASVEFDISNHPNKISIVEGLKGKSGCMMLEKLVISGLSSEEYLLFSAIDDSGKSIDQEVCEKLFYCSGKVASTQNIDTEQAERLKKESDVHSKATIYASAERDNEFFKHEQEKLTKWAEDMITSLESELAAAKSQEKAIRRELDLATTVEEQVELQKKLKAKEREKKRLRQEIFDREDEIENKRDILIEALKKKLSQKTTQETLFIIRWSVV